MNNYDKYDKYSIEKYGQEMVGKTFSDLIIEDTNNTFVREDEASYGTSHENTDRKGGLGEIVEERFFHYKTNSNPEADFKEAGVELKVTPYKVNKNGSLAAKERISLNMIDFFRVVNELDFYISSLWKKSQLLLLVYYLWEENKHRLDYRIDYVRLFTPPKEDLDIIESDYKKIINKIVDGKAHELSESDTMYLSACTKSSDSSVRRGQPNSDIPAKSRAFAYKNSYMTYVLNNYIVGKKPLYESITKDKDIDDFETYIIKQIEQYKGKSFEELCNVFDVKTTAKNIGSILTFRMLGIKSNNAEEFVKANIVVKTIRVERNGKIKENMSFPTFRFNEVANQEWEDSDLYNMLSSTRFLFVVFRMNEEGSYVLDTAKFWNIPNEDLDNEVRSVWEKTKDVLNNLPEKIHDGTHYISIFPKQSESRISHVRPHARDSKDTYTLPDGREYPKQCFWLNNSYILGIVRGRKESK